MSDISNEIIQTLGQIHNDIKSAKEALKVNVELDSNSTSTLAKEINKVPDSVMKNIESVDFNNPTTMSGGFIYETNSYVLNDKNAKIIQTKDGQYIIPTDKILNLPFINNIPKALNAPVGGYSLKYDGTEIDMLLQWLYREFAINNLLCLKKVSSNKTIFSALYLRGNDSAYDNDTKTYFCDSFSMPSINAKVLYNNKEINRVKCDNFKLSANFNITEVICNKLTLDLDTVYYFARLFSDDNGYGYKDYEKYNERLNSNEPYLKIIMKDINFEYDHLCTSNKIDAISTELGSADNYKLFRNSKIGIYVDDSNKENLSKLDDVYVRLNVLRFFTVYSMDGSKCYDFKDKKFIPKEEFDRKVIDALNIDIYPYKSWEKFLSYNSSVIIPFNTKGVGEQPSFKFDENDLKKYNIDISNALPEYCSITDSGLIYTDNKSGLKNILLLNPNPKDGVYKISLGDYYPKIIPEAISKLKLTDHTFKFSLDYNNKIFGEVTKMPFLYSCVGDGRSTYPLEGNKLVFTDPRDISNKDNGYFTLEDGQDKLHGLLLASPYDTEFISTSYDKYTDTTTTYHANRLVTQYCPIVINKHIKNITIVDTAYIMTQWTSTPYLLGSNTEIPEVPAEPVKITFNSNTKLCGIEDILFGYVSKQFVLGPYSTDISAKYWDKFINILVPEDYEYLGKYSFNKYRLPVYNLDKTKKYNYSKKSWEPIDALTDDSIETEKLFSKDERIDEFNIKYIKPVKVGYTYLKAANMAG